MLNGPACLCYSKAIPGAARHKLHLTKHGKGEIAMKKRILSIGLALTMLAALLAGCGSKSATWKVTCPWPPW